MLKFGNTYLNFGGTYLSSYRTTANDLEPQFIFHQKRTSPHDMIVHYYDNELSAYEDFTAKNIAFFSTANLFENGEVNISDTRMIRLKPEPCWPPLSSKNSNYSACLFHNPTNETEGYFYFLTKDLDNEYLADLTNNTQSNPGSGEILLYKTPDREVTYPQSASLYAFENEQYSSFNNIYNTKNKNYTVNLRKIRWGYTNYYEQYLSANTPYTVENLYNVDLRKTKLGAVNSNVGWYGGWLLTGTIANCTGTNVNVVSPFNKVDNCINCTVIENRTVPIGGATLTDVRMTVNNCSGGNYASVYMTANNCSSIVVGEVPGWTVVNSGKDIQIRNDDPKTRIYVTATDVDYIGVFNYDLIPSSDCEFKFNRCKISGNDNAWCFNRMTSAGLFTLYDCTFEGLSGYSGIYNWYFPVIYCSKATRNWYYNHGNATVTLDSSCNHVSAGYWRKTSTNTKYPNYVDNGSANVFYEIGTF